ncbi:MAG: hypothetical protein NTX61_12540 [Bacteroidetes bacterium]|nr:hypothetical protein [Bacteroidota bacterium]
MENKYKQQPGADPEIDDLFRKGLSGQQTNPPDYVWSRIDKKLLLREILRFNFTNISGKWWIIGAATIVLLGITGYFMFIPGTEPIIKVAVRTETGIALPKPIPSSPAISNAAPSKNQNHKTHLLAPTVKQKYPTNPIANKTNKINHPLLETIAVTTTKPDNDATMNISSQTEIASVELIGKSVPDYTPAGSQVELNLTDASVTPIEHSKTLTPVSLSESKQEKTQSPNSATASPVIPGQDITKSRKKDTYFSAGFSIQPEISINKNNSFYTKANYWGNVDLGFHLNNFSVHTGIGLGLVDDDGHYKLNYQSNDSIGYYVKVISYTYDDTQPGQIFYDTIRVPVFYSVSHIGHNLMKNRYTYLQIPLLLDYKLFETPKFRLFIKGGAAVSFLIGRNEPVPTDYYLNGTVINIENTSAIRKTTNWQLLLSLLLEYKLSKTVGIFAEPTYRYFFDAIRENKNTQVQEPYSLGLGVGLMLNFGHNKYKK